MAINLYVEIRSVAWILRYKILCHLSFVVDEDDGRVLDADVVALSIEGRRVVETEEMPDESLVGALLAIEKEIIYLQRVNTKSSSPGGVYLNISSSARANFSVSRVLLGICSQTHESHRAGQYRPWFNFTSKIILEEFLSSPIASGTEQSDDRINCEETYPAPKQALGARLMCKVDLNDATRVNNNINDDKASDKNMSIRKSIVRKMESIFQKTLKVPYLNKIANIMSIQLKGEIFVNNDEIKWKGTWKYVKSKDDIHYRFNYQRVSSTVSGTLIHQICSPALLEKHKNSKGHSKLKTPKSQRQPSIMPSSPHAAEAVSPVAAQEGMHDVERVDESPNLSCDVLESSKLLSPASTKTFSDVIIDSSQCPLFGYWGGSFEVIPGQGTSTTIFHMKHEAIFLRRK